MLKPGVSGEDVRALQETLITLGYELPRYGADGDYGDETVAAVKAFQTKTGLSADGIYGAQTHAALMAAADNHGASTPDAPDTDDAQPDTSAEIVHKLRISAEGRWNVRSGPGTEYGVITVVSAGTELEHIATAYNGWHCIRLADAVGWVSSKCSEVVA